MDESLGDFLLKKMEEENEIKHRKCEKDLIEEQNKKENKELFLKMDEMLKEIEDETYYIRFKIPINEFLKILKNKISMNLKIQKGVEFGFIELSKAVNMKQEVVGYIWTYAVPGSFKGSYKDIGQEDGISLSCVKIKLLNLLKNSYKYEIGYW